MFSIAADGVKTVDVYFQGGGFYAKGFNRFNSSGGWIQPPWQE